jgi:Arc/MetJ family transcription regulator
MRTTIEIDPELIAKAKKMTGARTKREVIHRALTELVREPPDYSALLALAGKVQFHEGYDPRAPYGVRASIES